MLLLVNQLVLLNFVKKCRKKVAKGHGGSPKEYGIRRIQTVDKTNGFRQIAESFGQAFSKACAVEAAQASSPSAEGEKTCFSAFFFLLSFFSFAPFSSKENF